VKLDGLDGLDGFEGLTASGSYPAIGLSDARCKRFEIKQQLANNIDST